MDKEVKQVILMRKDLKMRRGKEIAQGAHVSMKVLLDQMKPYNNDLYIQDKQHGFKLIKEDKGLMLSIPQDSPLDLWLSGLFTKICLQVNSKEELVKLYEDAKSSGLLCSIIEDAGLTEFHGEKTLTCAAIGPAYSEDIDKITGHLKLL